MLKQDGNPIDYQITTDATVDFTNTVDLDQLGVDGLWHDVPEKMPSVFPACQSSQIQNEPPPPLQAAKPGEMMFVGLEEAMPDPDVAAEL